MQPTTSAAQDAQPLPIHHHTLHPALPHSTMHSHHDNLLLVSMIQPEVTGAASHSFCSHSTQPNRCPLPARPALTRS